MSNNSYGQPDNQQNPFTQGRYQQPSSPYGQQNPYGQSNPYGQQAPYGQQNPYGQAQQNPFLSGGQVQPYRPSSTPAELRRFEQMNLINHFGSVFVPFLSIVMFFIEKGKNRVYDQQLREAMNMGLTRIMLGGIGSFAAAYIHSGFGAVFGIISFVYFILAILGAVESMKAFKEGRGHEYKGAIPFTRPDN